MVALSLSSGLQNAPEPGPPLPYTALPPLLFQLSPVPNDIPTYRPIDQQKYTISYALCAKMYFKDNRAIACGGGAAFTHDSGNKKPLGRRGREDASNVGCNRAAAADDGTRRSSSVGSRGGAGGGAQSAGGGKMGDTLQDAIMAEKVVNIKYCGASCGGLEESPPHPSPPPPQFRRHFVSVSSLKHYKDKPAILLLTL